MIDLKKGHLYWLNPFCVPTSVALSNRIIGIYVGYVSFYNIHTFRNIYRNTFNVKGHIIPVRLEGVEQELTFEEEFDYRMGN